MPMESSATAVQSCGLCSSAFLQKRLKMQQKLDRKPQDHHGARSIGSHPIWIFNDLENRQRVIFAETSLIEGFSFVPKRMIHSDQRISAFVFLIVDQMDQARKILGNVGAGIGVMVKFFQRERERV